jgi:hypothetical protein
VTRHRTCMIFTEATNEVSRARRAFRPSNRRRRSVPNGRRTRFVDVPDLGTVAVATFVIEGFARGNNVHQYLAIFGPPGERSTASNWPYFALSAITEVGDGCAVDVRGVWVSKVQNDLSVDVTLPTFLIATTGYCGEEHRTYVLRSIDNATLKRLELKQ